MSKKIILLAGPTASGKSNLAINLAKKINGEIINADSMQVYKNFKILSSRPTLSDTKKIKHHLYGFLKVDKYFSAGDWLKICKLKIDDCLNRKKTPIIVGGTGLYFNTITNGISQIPNIDTNLRKKVRQLFKQLGPLKFYKKLKIIDPKIKNKIIQTDTQRLQRAYEVKLKTNKSLLDWIKNTKSDFQNYDLRKIFINTPRKVLLKNISNRIDLMFKNKCVDEVKNFKKVKLNNSLSANKLIGVREINKFLEKSISLEQCKEIINIRTRQYAKRQNTWARGHMNNWNKLYSKDLSVLLKKILKVVS